MVGTAQASILYHRTLHEAAEIAIRDGATVAVKGILN